MSSPFEKTTPALIVCFLAGGLLAIPLVGIVPLIAAIIVIYGITVFVNQFDRTTQQFTQSENKEQEKKK